MKKSESIKNKVYKFVHYEDVYIQTNILNRGVKYEWLEIEDDGKITVKGSNPGGYAWDGCSPKKNFMDLCIGTPDGRLDFETEKPITYYASLFHDAFYQYKKEVPLSRKEVDHIFRLSLRPQQFRFRTIYYCFIRIGGGIYGKWKSKGKQNDILINECSWLKNKTNAKAHL